MGMFDHVTCELPMPDGREVIKDSFQTKSLWCCMDLFTITAAGRLIFHKRRYHCAGEKDERGKPLMPEYVADIDLEYHGDIEIYGLSSDKTGVRYAVRFTHGTVEWIRPFEELTELDQWRPMERDY
jgi:hypothetical protein